MSTLSLFWRGRGGVGWEGQEIHYLHRSSGQRINECGHGRTGRIGIVSPFNGTSYPQLFINNLTLETTIPSQIEYTLPLYPAS